MDIELAGYPKVSVVIPAYNEEESINGTIQSVINLDYPSDRLEIIVVDDGSRDATVNVVQEIIKQNPERDIKLISQPNQGKASALNNALAKLEGEFFACLDADSVVEKSTLKKMLVVYERNDANLAIVTPSMMVLKPKTLLQKLQKMEYLLAMFLCRLKSQLDCIYVAPGPFSLYRTEIIQKLGGFDVNNLTEDQEIAYRVQLNQFAIKQCHEGYVYTITPHTLRKLYKQRNRWSKGGILNFLKYKKLFLNPAYGDFGLIQMLTNVTLFFLATTTVGFFAYFWILPTLTDFKNLALVGFDIKPYFDTFTINIDFLGSNITKALILLVMFSCTAFFFYLAHKNARERISGNSVISVILYFLIYFLILSFIGVIVLVELAIGKRQKW